MKMHSVKHITLVLLTMTAVGAVAQEVQYITDTLYVPVRSGKGTEYRIVHRGLPSGTRVEVQEEDSDSGYTRIVTAGGTEGWVLTRYLMDTPAAAQRLEDLQQRYDAITGDESSLRAQLAEARNAISEKDAEAAGLQQALAETREELKDIKRISANALTLDNANRQLAQETQVLQTRIELLEADNQRLKDSDENQAFINGALAVLLGVIITLLVPRLRPKRRPSSSWA
ncbi:MAG: TIGR04211 family SH3 domain-containing protein [Halieaceae bacterium]|jgi:SH3 domain protein|nr:TIGR04211 family SH3 domain-containing protein [Halieaceae bacterium]